MSLLALFSVKFNYVWSMSLTKKFNFQFFLPLFLITLVQGKDFEVDFARHVLPILSNKCFACHGPDTKEDKLVRLDLENLAKKDLGDTMRSIQI